MNVFFQIDPLEKLNLKTDSSLRLMQEAFLRGMNVWFYHPQHIALQKDHLFVSASKVELPSLDNIQITKTQRIDLNEADAIWIRQDPPFDMAYISNTYFLEKLPSSVKVFNNPTSIRNFPEKLLPLEFVDFCPPTIITRDITQIMDFFDAHPQCIIKPLYGHGGDKIFKTSRHDPNLMPLLETFLDFNREPFIIQEYLSAVENSGDKRMLLVNGNPVAIYRRKAGHYQVRSNSRVGGSIEGCAMSERDLEIAKRIGPRLQELGLFFVGIDIIGEHLTEINVTSPTGIAAVEALYNKNIAKEIWDQIQVS